MTTTLEGISFHVMILIEPLHDPIVEALGHDPRSEYVERFWLPVLGPSTTWLIRYLGARLDADPCGCTLDVGATAALGLGERSGRHGPFLRSMARAIDFDVAALVEPGEGRVFGVGCHRCRRDTWPVSPSTCRASTSKPCVLEQLAHGVAAAAGQQRRRALPRAR